MRSDFITAKERLTFKRPYTEMIFSITLFIIIAICIYGGTYV